MHGTMMTITPAAKITTELVDPKIAADTTQMLPKMKAAIGGGYIEKIPGFDSICVGKEVHTCIALCDEDGKRKQMEFNEVATQLWNIALLAQGHPGLWTPHGSMADYLVGPIVILYGDKEFLEAL
jgi:hypothetical protein